VITGCPSPGGTTTPDPKLFTVTFDGNKNTGGTVPEPIEQTTEGESITLPGKGDLVKNTLVFGGWSEKEDGSNPKAAGASYKPTKDITLYAVWKTGGSEPTVTYTIKFDLNGGTKTGADIGDQTVDEGGSVDLPPSTGLAGPTTKPNFVGWNTEANKDGEVALSEYKPTGATTTITLYAIWTAQELYTVKYNLNGGTGTPPTDTKVIKDQALTSLPTKDNTWAGPTNKRIFLGWNVESLKGGTAVITTYTPTADNTTLYAIWGDGYIVKFNLNEGTGTPPPDVTVAKNSAVTPLPAKNDAWVGPAGKPIFLGWNTEEKKSGTEVITTYTPTADNTTLYAIWEAEEEEEIDLTKAIYKGAELVTLENACQAVYYFALPTGAKWGDYNGVKASYLVPQDATFERENSGRAQRLYGNYDASFFQFNTTTAGNKYAYASLDGDANNNQYILGDTGKGGWKTLSTALIDYFGECPDKDTWFTLEYKIDGSTSNKTPHPHLPYFGYNGPVILGLGLPGAGDPNSIFVKDVTLVHKTDAAKNVKGKALYITKDGYDYPAFSAYGTAAGNGVDSLARQIIGDGGMEKITIDAVDNTILAGSERVSLTNATQVVYKFVLPTGKTWGDYNGLDASYLVPDAATFEAENSGRTQRLYGVYDIDYFSINETTAGNKYAYASLDGNANNNQYILDDTGNGGWKTLSAALIAELGECPEAYEWFTIHYKIDGSRANVKPHKHLPDGSATGPFYIGLGLPGAGGVNTINMKDVTLLGTSAADNVVGTPLYITKDGVDYPAFSAFGTASSNGVDEIGRGKWDGSVDVSTTKGTAYVAPQEITVSFDVNETNGTAIMTTLTLKKNDSFLIRSASDLPTATTGTAGLTFKGWGLTDDATTPITTGDGTGGNGMAFSASASNVNEATLYAIWDSAPPLPDAAADLDITDTIDGKVGQFGGFAGATNGNLGPYAFDATKQYSCAIDFNFADVTELATYKYKEVEIEFSLSSFDGDTTTPFKLIFHAGRAHDAWSGGTASYGDYTADGTQTKTITLDADTLSRGIVIQHNGNSNTATPTTASASITLTKITLLKP